MRVLLHSCCGPCASACVPRLKAEGHEVVMYFANSNIDTEEEYLRRLAAAKTLAKADGVELVAEPYDHGEWTREVAKGYEGEPEKGERCRRCFRYNLAKTAAKAGELGMEGFCTSLTVSPHKVSAAIFEEGRRVCETRVVSHQDGCGTQGGTRVVSHQDGLEAGAEARQPERKTGGRGEAVFLEEDFKKREGFKVSMRRAKELGLYRQSYCGCEYGRWVCETQVVSHHDGGAQGDAKWGKLRVAKNFWERAKGLIGSERPRKGEGLLIPKCNAIHTFFMSYAIDATFIDGKGRVVKTVKNIKPWRPFVWGGWRARAVIETAAEPGPQRGPEQDAEDSKRTTAREGRE